MNVFFVDRDPYLAASMLCDKHVIKMILESAQLLSTTHRLLDGTSVKSGKRVKYVLSEPEESNIYKMTHENHPCAVWVRQSHQHYDWLYEHAIGLCDEYSRRYFCRTHKTRRILENYLVDTPRNIPVGCFLDPPQCMPEQYRQDDVVSAYRSYYIGDKARIAKWSAPAKVPDWFTMKVGNETLNQYEVS